MNIAEMGYFFDLESKNNIHFVADQIRDISLHDNVQDMTFYDALQVVYSHYGIRLTPREEIAVYNLLFV